MAVTKQAAKPPKEAPQPWPPMPTITLQAITELKTKILPIERSIPAVIITKVIPIPKMAKTAILIKIFLRLKRVKNVSGAKKLNMAVITINTNKI
ncbi:unannotated protein [freshwater metagenome]|uniref:Unannotated protein n=1 Tax=freshwater metagenome TaxID=449393 RepID=A0A6J7GNX7_9ZZZZ